VRENEERKERSGRKKKEKGKKKRKKKKIIRKRNGKKGLSNFLEIVICWYPEDRVPPHTSFKSRQGAGRASTHYHVPCSTQPLLPIEVSSGTFMCPAVPDLTFLSRWAPVLPYVLWPWVSPPC
jgi:hypothetical protein